MQRVIVVGAGAMGVQIALLCALRGYACTIVELDERSRGTALERARERVARQVAAGRVESEDADAALARIDVRADPGPLGDVEVAIEAITEQREAKRAVLAHLDRVLPPSAILASNSSSFVPSSLTTDLGTPERFVNIHFFNPVLAMRCVEIIAAPDTAAQTVARATAFVERLDRIPVVLKREIPGFIANRILNAVRDEALRLYEGGYADIDMIDLACRHALGYPMGPFELMDLTGIDIGYLTKTARFEETGDPADAPSATVRGLVERGTLGRKSGQGFYHYDAELRRGEPAL